MIEIIFVGEWATANEKIAADRGNRWAAASQRKAELENAVMMALSRRTVLEESGATFPIQERVHVSITWHVRTKRKDPDNISSAKKVLLDALVRAGILKDDGWAEVGGFDDAFFVSPHSPRAVVTLLPMSEE